jgi:hypothetical protein
MYFANPSFGETLSGVFINGAKANIGETLCAIFGQIFIGNF